MVDGLPMERDSGAIPNSRQGIDGDFVELDVDIWVDLSLRRCPAEVPIGVRCPYRCGGE